ncbi:MAG: hypothetical protein ER33_10245 [Cyanobium sp. CACIAM 14]|nr:MAG: hypothetical protein ER33_10245 [Cyanobium sp. CACIAM 14]
MDPVSPVAQLAVAAISGAAFLVSVAVMPFPKTSTDASAGFSLPPQTVTVQPTSGPVSPPQK